MGKIVFFSLGALMGAGLAMYAANVDKEQRRQTQGSPTQKQEIRRADISELVACQKNLDSLDRKTLLDWFADETEGNPGGKSLLLLELSDSALESIGYQMDTPLDREHYLLGLIHDDRSSRQLTISLFNFTEMEPSLREMLHKADGVLRVSGGSPKEENDAATAENRRVIHVEKLDFPTLKDMVQEKLDPMDQEPGGVP